MSYVNPDYTSKKAFKLAVAAAESDAPNDDDAYDRFVDWAIEDAESEHECPKQEVIS